MALTCMHEDDDKSVVGEIYETHIESSLATGVQTKTITLSEGTVTAIKEIIVSVGTNGNEWGADGYLELHRTGGTPDSTGTSVTRQGKTYLNSSNAMIFKHNVWSGNAVQVKIDHNAGSAKDVRFTIRYYYR